MVASEHPEVAEGRRRLIAMEVPDPEEESEDGSIDDDGDASDEEDDSGPVEAGMRVDITSPHFITVIFFQTYGMMS